MLFRIISSLDKNQSQSTFMIESKEKNVFMSEL